VVFLLPALAEFEEGLFAEVFLGEGEDEALLLVKMFPGEQDGGGQGLFGLVQVVGCLDAGEVLFDFLVFVVKRFTVTELIDAMFQRVQQEGVLDLAVGVHHGGQHVTHGMDFSEGSGGGKRGLQVVEEIVEDDVFGVKGLGYFHGGGD